MVFAEKLKLIMQLTQTTNSRLAAAINVDPSLISRLKSGDRFVSSKSDYLSNMAEYFGSKCNDSFRSLTMLEILGAGFGEDIVFALERWFLDESIEPKKESISEFYSPLSGRKNKIRNEKYSYFHGTDAMSRAAGFINDLAEQNGKVKVIKMLSDCNNGRGSVDLLECCAETILSQAENGTEIIRVVPNFTDMQCAINDIFTGFSILEECRLECYYYHNFKEGVFNNRLLVIPDAAVMVSESVSENGVEPTIVITDKKAVGDYDKLFDEYISYCSHGIRTQPFGCLHEKLDLFFGECDDFCNIYGNLSFERTTDSGRKSVADFIGNILKTNNVTEIFSLIKPENLADNSTSFYAAGYKEFLAETLELLENEANYNVVILPETDFVEGNIFIRRNGEAVYLPKKQRDTFGILNHPLSVNTLWQYFVHDVHCSREERKRKSIEEIKACIDLL